MESATLFHVLLAMATIVAAAQLAGKAFHKLRQPVVIGEMLAGIALGPSLLGRFAPAVQAALIPEAIVPHLRIVSQIGVVLFMFLVGLELDTRELRARVKSAVSISLSGIVVPLGIGIVVAIGVRSRLAPPGVAPSLFIAFMAVAMSVTAFPVLENGRGVSRRASEHRAQGPCLEIDLELAEVERANGSALTR